MNWIGGTLNGDGLVCRRCGVSQLYGVPAPIAMVVAIMEAFQKIHRTCQDRGQLPSTGDRLTDWTKSGDTGTSANTIATVLSGRIIGTHRDAPHDPDDFGRCYRLLALFPEWRTRLPEVAAVFPVWAGLVREWDTLTAIYERDQPKGNSSELYRLIDELRGGP